MPATALLEHLQDDPARFDLLARTLVEAAMLENTVLDKMGPLMYSLKPDLTPSARNRSRQVFAAWHRWIGEAETLADRLRLSNGDGRLPDYARALGEAVDAARFRVRMSLDEFRDAMRRAAEGEGVPLEEVRRELQDKLRRSRAGQVEAA